MLNPFLWSRMGQVRLMQELIRAKCADGMDTLVAFDHVSKLFTDDVSRSVIRLGLNRTKPRPIRRGWQKK